MVSTQAPSDRALPLRERKRRRMRRALAETALRRFLDQGFEATTLDDLLDEVEVSKRTFYAHYSSKEDVALAAELELWEVYAAGVAAAEIHGPVLTALRDVLGAVLRELGDEWTRRFLATRGLIARTPALRNHSALLSILTQERIVEVLETTLGVDSRTDVRLRLLGEFCLSAWRCGAKNWVAGRGQRSGRGAGGVATLIRRVEEAFDAIPGSLALTVP